MSSIKTTILLTLKSQDSNIILRKYDLINLLYMSGDAHF